MGRARAARRRDPLRVSLAGARGRPVRAPGLATWLAGAAPVEASGREVSVALVSDRVMRRLNLRFRALDRVTDVLSFPTGDDDGSTRGGYPGRPEPDGSRALGDIVIATGVARRQARRAGHPYGIELRVLALHGLLHLLGYDHESDTGEMARTERRLRRRSGLPVGVIERGASR